MALVRFVHAWDWICVSKIWFEGYHPKPQGGTNFSRGATNVLQAYNHKTQSLMKNGGQQKCLDKALHMCLYFGCVSTFEINFEFCFAIKIFDV